MTNDSPITQFSAAPSGWRVALSCPDTPEILVLPLVGWAVPTSNMSRTSTAGGDLPLEPVVLFDNVGEPLVTTLAEVLSDWEDGESLHQILAPGFEVREAPTGWAVREYGD